MAVSTFAGTITAPASPNTSVVTGVGFQPSVVLLFCQASSAAGNLTQAVQCIGFAVGTSSFASICSASRHNIAGASQSFRRHSNTKALTVLNHAGSVVLEATVSAVGADGFTVSYSTYSSGTLINYIAIGGADITGVAIKEITSPAGTGTQAYTGVGFQPHGIMMIGTGSSSATDVTDGTANGLGVGYCDASLNQNCSSWVCEDAVATSNTSSAGSSTEIINLCGPTESTRFAAAVSTIGSDGFSLNWSTTSGAGSYFWALCLRGTATSVGSFTQATSLGTQTTPSVGSLNIGTVRGVLFSSFGQTSAGTTATAYHTSGRMAGSGQGYEAITDLDGQAMPATTRKFLSNTNAWGRTNTSGTVIAQAAKSSFADSNFVLDYGTVDASARVIYYMALGDAPPAPAGTAAGSMLLLGVGK